MTGTILTTGTAPGLLWAAASRPVTGEDVSGDAFVVAPRPRGALTAVVDGLGHGREAALAAKIGVATIESYAAEPVGDILRHCHEMLMRTRGAAMCVAALDLVASSLAWLSIGNVEGLVVHADASRRDAVVALGGVIGGSLPRLIVPQPVRLQPGDLLVVTTDGIQHGFSELLAIGAEPARIAMRVMEGHGKDTDDALVFVGKHVGCSE